MELDSASAGGRRLMVLMPGTLMKKLEKML